MISSRLGGLGQCYTVTVQTAATGPPLCNTLSYFDERPHESGLLAYSIDTVLSGQQAEGLISNSLLIRSSFVS